MPPTDTHIAARLAWAIDTLDRRMAIVDDLVATAGDPLDWLGLRRQVAKFAGYAGSVNRERLTDEVAAAFDRHLAWRSGAAKCSPPTSTPARAWPSAWASR